MNSVVDEAVRQALEVFDESEAWSTWAEGWLSGRDTSAESADKAYRIAEAIADSYEKLPSPKSFDDVIRHDAAIAATYAAKAACQHARFASREFCGADPALYILRSSDAVCRIWESRRRLEDLRQQERDRKLLEEILRRLEFVEKQVQSLQEK